LSSNSSPSKKRKRERKGRKGKTEREGRKEANPKPGMVIPVWVLSTQEAQAGG
jgi:hypothetical protein